jgi:hypothetical protein
LTFPLARGRRFSPRLYSSGGGTANLDIGGANQQSRVRGARGDPMMLSGHSLYCKIVPMHL